ncbi:hypothetical protein D030_4398, partial [Vibrio parahaemolyticus AQ3810]
ARNSGFLTQPRG